MVSFNYARTERTFFDKELEADFDKLEAAGPAGSEVSPPTLNLAPDPDSAPAPDPNDDPNLNANLDSNPNPDPDPNPHPHPD